MEGEDIYLHLFRQCCAVGETEMRVLGSCFPEARGEAGMYAVSPTPVRPMFQRGESKFQQEQGARSPSLCLRFWDECGEYIHTGTLYHKGLAQWGLLSSFPLSYGREKTAFS